MKRMSAKTQRMIFYFLQTFAIETGISFLVIFIIIILAIKDIDSLKPAIEFGSSFLALFSNYVFQIKGIEKESYSALILILSFMIIVVIPNLFYSYMWAQARYKGYKIQLEIDEYRTILTTTLAHDLKTPLAAISGYAENLIANVHTEKREIYAESILKNTRYIDKLITDTLDLAKIKKTSEISMEDCDVSQLIKDSLDRLSEEIQKKELIIKFEGNCKTHANPQMMAQMITNLIGNAVRYTPDKGTVEITLDADDDYLCISNDVTEDVENAYELIKAFCKGDSSRSSCSGSGLGLTIAKQIANLHDFWFNVDSKDNKFTVEIEF